MPQTWLKQIRLSQGNYFTRFGRIRRLKLRRSCIGVAGYPESIGSTFLND